MADPAPRHSILGFLPSPYGLYAKSQFRDRPNACFICRRAFPISSGFRMPPNNPFSKHRDLANRSTRIYRPKRTALLCQVETPTTPVPLSRTALTFREEYSGKFQSWILTRLEELGFVHPTDVQRAAFQVLLSENPSDIVLHAQTGSGKTLAYLLPLLNNIDLSRSAVQALIVVPTSELGMQVYKVARRLASGWIADNQVLSNELNLKIDPLAPSDKSESETDAESPEADEFLDGEPIADETIPKSGKVNNQYLVLPLLDQADFRRQKLQLRQAAPRVVIATPKRLIEIARTGRLQLHTISFVVIDEFDACLNDPDTTRELQEILTSPIYMMNVRGLGQEVEDLRIGDLDDLLSSHEDLSLSTPNPNFVGRSASGASGLGATLGSSTSNLAEKEAAQIRREKRRTVLASATVPSHRHFLKQCIAERWTADDVVHIYLSEDEPLPEQLDHYFIICDKKKKLAAAKAALISAQPVGAILFVNHNRNVSDVAKQLNDWFAKAEPRPLNFKGMALTAVPLDDSMEVAERKKYMAAFRSGEASVLVSTDLGARGLDVPHVSHVIHLDLPDSRDGYLHRSGRAGRNGKHGVVISLCDDNETFVLERYSNALDIDFNEATKKSLKSWDKEMYE